MSKGSKAPATPDPYATAAAQTASNKETALTNAQLNRISQVTPYGTLTYSKSYDPADQSAVDNYNRQIAANNDLIKSLQAQISDTQAPVRPSGKGTPGAALRQYETDLRTYNTNKATLQRQIDDLLGKNKNFSSQLDQFIPNYTQTQTLAPEQQQLLDLQNRGSLLLGNTAIDMGQQVRESYDQPIDLSGAPGVASRIKGSDTAKAVQDAQDAVYRKQTAFLDPQYQQTQERLETQLANQGLARGSEAYQRAMADLLREKEFSYGQARDSAVQAGIAAQNQFFNQDLSQANLQNAAQAQYLQEEYAKRNQPLNEFNSLLSGAQVTQPGFQAVPVAGVDGVDITGAINNAYQGQVNAYNQRAANRNSTTGGLLGLAGTLGGAYLAGPIGAGAGGAAGRLFG